MIQVNIYESSLYIVKYVLVKLICEWFCKAEWQSTLCQRYLCFKNSAKQAVLQCKFKLIQFYLLSSDVYTCDLRIQDLESRPVIFHIALYLLK